MPLPDLTHPHSSSPAPSIPSLRRDDLPNPLPTIVTSADDSLPLETEWYSYTDPFSERDMNWFLTNIIENRLSMNRLHALRDHDQGMVSVPHTFTHSCNELGISGIEDSGEIEYNYVEDPCSTFAVESVGRGSEVDVSMQGSDSINSGLPVVGVESDSNPYDVNWEGSPNPFWDNFNSCIQYLHDDFEWEVVEERVDEREISSVVVDRGEEFSLVSGSSNLEESVEEVNRCEILSVGSNMNWEQENYTEAQFPDLEDYMYAAEYEAEYDDIFGEFLMDNPPAAKSAVENLPLVDLKAENILTGEVCTVCKVNFSMEEKVRKLPCSHYYHDDCILPWLHIRNTCPVCRYELPTDDPYYERWNSGRAIGGLQTDSQSGTVLNS